MRSFFLPSLRARLLLLVCLAVVPALALALSTASEQRRLATIEVQDNALRLARLAASSQEGLFEGAHQLLVTLSHLSEVRRGDAASCSRLFADLVKAYPLYVGFGVIQADGNIFCSSTPFPRPLTVADRDYFQRAIQTRSLAVGEYQIGRVSGKPSVNFAYPIFDDAGEIRGVAVAALDLSRLSEMVKKAKLPSGAMLTMTDRNGIVLVRYPDSDKWIGQPAPESQNIQVILSQGGRGEASGPAGVPHLFGVTRLTGTGGEFYISVAVPKAEAFADADQILTRNLLWIGFAGLMALAAVRIGGDRLILREFDALEARYRALVEHIPAGTFLTTLDERTLYVSPQIERMFNIPASVWMSEPRYWIKQVDPIDQERVIAELHRFLTDGEPFNSDYRMRTANGRLIWVHAEAVLVRDESGRPQCIQGIVLDITDRMREADLREHQALHDALTNLPNRVLLRDRLEQAVLTRQRGGKPLALLIMDLNRFREVNDTLGHHHGDLLLKQVGSRLKEIVRMTDTVARLGGDEFAILLPGESAEGAVMASEKILKTLERPFSLEGQTVDVGASIGIALCPDHGSEADLLIQRADVAMYAAKESGNSHAVYASERDPHTTRRLALLSGLRQAIQKNQLFLLYQPKIDLRTSRPIGVEALVRWQHPDLGPVAPDQFIPLAEQTGLIKPLTLWVLEEALRQCRTWRDEGLEVLVAVNLSARNLQDPHLCEEVTWLLEAHDLPADLLELEITESFLMADPVRAMEILSELNGKGIHLAIDDFGIGYSSLGYLKRLPAAVIKIDKSFVKGLAEDKDDAMIVRSTIDLAHNLGRKVVAEGVESKEICEVLASLGCDAAQGYYFSRPIPPKDLSNWFKNLPNG
ncbi:MAG: EAL domain-containing protein (plasmid) [Candidatus Manganitrophus sp.]|nr:EAL domain-containing protein [Candidatus Manganitrophus sp.]MDC4228226.1 EAL domain-containing protein [Candidatus Manganitrophus sp.]WDT77793.1 MAG: EAL domain-containing protein [Candidatus Manganitrophus sp.]